MTGPSPRRLDAIRLPLALSTLGLAALIAGCPAPAPPSPGAGGTAAGGSSSPASGGIQVPTPDIADAPSAELVWSISPVPGDDSYGILSSIVRTKDGSIFVTNAFDHYVYRLDSSGKQTGRWLPIPDAPDTDIKGLAAGPDGNLRVIVSLSADPFNPKVLTLSPDGKKLAEAPCEFMSDQIAVGPGGETWIAGGSDFKRTRPGEAPEDVGGFLMPQFLGTDADGRLYLIENEKTLLRLGGAEDDEYRVEAREGWGFYGGVVAEDGTAYVVAQFRPPGDGDGMTQIPPEAWIRKYDSDGKYLAPWRCPDLKTALGAPMAIDGEGNIYVDSSKEMQMLLKYHLPGE